MWKALLYCIVFVGTAGIYPVTAQQYIIADKDNTRPHENRKLLDNTQAAFTSFQAVRYNGYNEIQWEVINEKYARRFIVEYSIDGTDYETAGETPVTGTYLIRHYTDDDRPMLYRLRTEGLDGRFYYSNNILLDGEKPLPVKIFPTIITGSLINAKASWPVERIAVTSPGGMQVFVKDVNGQQDFISVALPSLAKGMYWITFTGNGWQSTEKFLVP